MSVETNADTGKKSGTLVSRLDETLRRAIASGQFPPGSKLPSEAQLTAAHGVSRTVVREAIAALRADRLVEARQGAGVFVLETSAPNRPAMLSLSNTDLARVSSMIELLELRTAVEVEAAGLAALRRSPAQEEVILERHDAVRACLEASKPTSEADFALHLAIAEATNNPRFREFLTMIGRNLIPRAALRPDDSEADQAAYIKLLDDEHNAIVSAISMGDEEGAREAMRRHLRGAQLRYRTLLREMRESVR
ncbi:GntR family transcriptional regulator [Neorhizobium sp. R1-B]|jgi:GntR family transcriptional regulator, transcriptional repressor for pyruvate dehydrogenase complex|uniref:FadR/GntR family transcriptional regulator n=1 Tax=Neorhizobium TaxID=1525371 RepID=UPI000CF85958|nr:MULTISPECIES: FadR/GntR family transcriptional regulator [Neorhizobium]TCV65507.1 GntR family transcriptional regulator [Neorhizobium sp. S3-V5DH]TDX77182.1 GntR family transcriptional regulator [Neorhizobium sp. R1-B]